MTTHRVPLRDYGNAFHRPATRWAVNRTITISPGDREGFFKIVGARQISFASTKEMLSLAELLLVAAKRNMSPLEVLDYETSKGMLNAEDETCG